MSDYERAESFVDLKPDSAFYYYNKVAGATKDSLQIAKAYNGMAELQSDAGDYFGSQESLLNSLRYLDEQKESNYSCLSADDNELGMTSVKLNHPDAAIGYYQQAVKLTDNPDFQATILNNEANVYQKSKDYTQALQLFDKAMVIAPAGGKTYSRILTNMTFTKWLRQPAFRPIADLLRALQIRLKLHDRWGLNSSYARLSDYYFLSRPDSALYYSQAMYTIARQINSPADQLEALQKLITLGSPQDAKRYFTNYQRISDSLQNAHDHTNNQFALIRYDSQKNKADYLSSRAAVIRQRTWLISALLLLGVIVVGGTIWYYKRKHRLHEEAERKIQESRLQISQTVHDVVANGLYRMMSALEHEMVMDKEKLLDDIEDLYKKSRNISYEPDVKSRPFSEQVTDLLAAFSADYVRIAAIGNEVSTWEGLSVSLGFEISHILQELLVNMKKHSQATNVIIRFNRNENQVTIDYLDNGIGLPSTFNYGNGLRNTEIRIKAIQGRIRFENGLEHGLSVHISFPIV